MAASTSNQASRVVVDDTAVRPFQVSVPDEDLAELRRRIALARWPSRELVTDRSQGVQLAALQELARYWASDYDLRRVEAKLNALPQFTHRDRRRRHPLPPRHVPHQDALPLLITHGWPGSVIELLEVVGPLTDPTAHGDRATEAFHLVLPSMPGYGFSGEPTEVGWDPGRTAQAWAELMARLGYGRYVAQGGDVGAVITDQLGRQAPQGLVGIHTNLLGDDAGRRRRPAGEPFGGGTRGVGGAGQLPCDWLWLLPGAGHPAPDDRLCPAGLPGRPGRLDAGPRHRQLLQDRPRLR